MSAYTDPRTVAITDDLRARTHDAIDCMVPSEHTAGALQVMLVTYLRQLQQ